MLSLQKESPIVQYCHNGAEISRIFNYVTTNHYLEHSVTIWNSSLNAYKVLHTLNGSEITMRFVVNLYWKLCTVQKCNMFAGVFITAVYMIFYILLWKTNQLNNSLCAWFILLMFSSAVPSCETAKFLPFLRLCILLGTHCYHISNTISTLYISS